MKALLALLAAVALASEVVATESPTAPASSGQSKLTIVVHHLFGDRTLALARPGLTTASGENISVTRLAYILSEPSLKPTNDATWLANRAWFGFIDASKGDGVSNLSGLPSQRFEQLRFCIGPDAVTDHADPSVYPPQHPLNPLVNGLHWGWTGGFVYLALEGMLTNKAESAGYSYHIAGESNRMTVTVPVALDLTRDATVELDFHVDRAFAGQPPLRISDVNSSHSRSGDEIATSIKKRIENAFTARSVHPTVVAVAISRLARGKPGSAHWHTLSLSRRQGFSPPGIADRLSLD